MESVSASISDVFGNLQAWAAAPFTQQMNLASWAYLTIAIVTITVLWLMILHDLKGDF